MGMSPADIWVDPRYAGTLQGLRSHVVRVWHHVQFTENWMNGMLQSLVLQRLAEHPLFAHAQYQPP